MSLNAGTAYTRWGHDSCKSPASLIYRGSMGSSHRVHGGGGANHLCMPFDPQYVPGIGNGGGSYVHGSEYEGVNNINSGKRNIQDRNIPCAVCQVQSRSTAIMVPARNTCPSGWTREYYGFLMGGHHRQGKRNFICMDRHMKTLPGHAGNQDGSTLYSVATQCGWGLNCPPYQSEKPLTCAMCSK